jgi:hypothetical protein
MNVNSVGTVDKFDNIEKIQKVMSLNDSYIIKMDNFFCEITEETNVEVNTLAVGK